MTHNAFVPPRLHVGRNWTDHAMEDECPCEQAPCGLVDTENTNPECTQHPFGRSKTVRQSHMADECPDAPGREPWYVKIRRYDGSESVVATTDTEDQACTRADELNRQYQTDTYYAEKFDPELSGKGFSSEESE